MPEPLPSEERVRELTADPKLTADDANRYADVFIAAGKPTIALMFLERSKDPSRLDRVKKDAVGAGDAFLLHHVHRLHPGSIEAAEWREAAARARAEGKLLFARECYAQAGDEELATQVREEWLKIFPAPGAKS
jgi:hypothetical protein